MTATSTVYSMGNHTNISPNAIATRAGTSGGGSSATTSTLTSDIATDLAATTATLNGTITSEGGASSTITGFDYGLTTSYGSQATSTYSAGTGTFHEHITSLTASTEYHFRAKSYNSQGWGYGADNTLTTGAAPSAHYYTTSGTWQAPAGITSVQIECYGAGGAGGAGGGSPFGWMSGAGGGGGGYSIVNSYVVTPGNNYSYIVGIKGIKGTSPGGDTTFNTNICVAKGGSNGGSGNNPGGAGGLAANGVGDTKYSGGTGYAGGGMSAGGGGASSAGTGTNGNNGGDGTGGTAPTGGYAGGNGGIGGASNSAPDNSETNYGGAGGGAGSGPNPGTGGNGTGGYIILTY